MSDKYKCHSCGLLNESQITKRSHSTSALLSMDEVTKGAEEGLSSTREAVQLAGYIVTPAILSTLEANLLQIALSLATIGVIFKIIDHISSPKISYTQHCNKCGSAVSRHLLYPDSVSEVSKTSSRAELVILEGRTRDDLKNEYANTDLERKFLITRYFADKGWGSPIDKVPCDNCCVMVLPSTVAKTNVLCMPCHKGGSSVQKKRREANKG